jgi:CRP-like cAMP-binding protein
MRNRRVDVVAHRLEELGFGRAAARQLSTAGTLLHLDAGAVLCREGERGTQAFLLLCGEAAVELPDTTVQVGPGEVVGELATLDPHRLRNATVVAAGPVEVLVFDVATYRSLARFEELRDRLAPARTLTAA